MKSLVSFALLTALGLVASEFSATCRDEAIDPTTKILTANRSTGNGRGTLKAASLDLDDCFRLRLQ
ncbi:CVNH domain-containing protein [Colletotrichum graminicola]|nr:CVNH domain-containing protein [Colletotrichum graminicola]